MAIVLGSGYVKMGWNATSGEIYDYTEKYMDCDLIVMMGQQVPEDTLINFKIQLIMCDYYRTEPQIELFQTISTFF